MNIMILISVYGLEDSLKTARCIFMRLNVKLIIHVQQLGKSEKASYVGYFLPKYACVNRQF